MTASLEHRPMTQIQVGLFMLAILALGIFIGWLANEQFADRYSLVAGPGPWAYRIEARTGRTWRTTTMDAEDRWRLVRE